MLAMDWMEGLTDEWLMIFDDCNLDDRKNQLPGRGKGNIIYTSRLNSLRNALGRDNVLEVPPLRESEAIELLLKASGSLSTSLDDQGRASAQSIVRELGCLPLGVDKAAASIRDGQIPLETYLEKLRKEKVRLKNTYPSEDHHVEHLAVYAALELSSKALMDITRVKGRGTSGWVRAPTIALKILQLLSFYHHTEIPITIWERAAEQRRSNSAEILYPLDNLDSDLDVLMFVGEDGNWDTKNFFVCLNMLRQFSFVKVNPHSMAISMHILVQQWAQHRIRDVAKQAAMKAAAQTPEQATEGALERAAEQAAEKSYAQWSLLARILVIESTIPEMHTRHIRFARFLRPHIESCLGATTLPGLDDARYKAFLLFKLGWYHIQMKNFEGAEGLLKEAVHLGSALDDFEDFAVEAMRCLARSYHELGRLGDSEKVYREILDGLKSRLDDRVAYLDRLKVASNTSSQEASPKPSNGGPRGFTVKLLKRLTSPGSTPNSTRIPSHQPDTLASQDFIPALTRTITLVYGELSYVIIDQGRLLAGKHMLQAVLEDLGEALGERNPVFLAHKYQLQRLTDPSNTEYWEKEFEDTSKLQGEECNAFYGHECFYILWLGLANSYVCNEQWPSALFHLDRAMNHIARSYGFADRKMLDLLRLISKANMGAGEFDLAVHVARKCVEMAESTYGEIHNETILSLEQLFQAVLSQRLDFDEEGIEILRDAIRRARLTGRWGFPIVRRLHAFFKEFPKVYEEVDYEEAAATASEPDTAGPRPVFSAAMWKSITDVVDREVARFGPDHPFTPRLQALKDGGQPRNMDQWLEKVLACHGPHSQKAKDAVAQLKERDGTIAKLILKAGARGGSLVVPPFGWWRLEHGVKLASDFLGPDNPVSQHLVSLLNGGPVKTLDELLERVRGSFGPEHSITKGVEEVIMERGAALHRTDTEPVSLRSGGGPRGGLDKVYGHASLDFFEKMPAARSRAAESRGRWQVAFSTKALRSVSEVDEEDGGSAGDVNGNVGMGCGLEGTANSGVR